MSLFGTLYEVLTERLRRTPQLASSYGYTAPFSDPWAVIQVLAQAVEGAGCRCDGVRFGLCV